MVVNTKGVTGGALIGAMFYDQIYKEIDSALVREFDEKDEEEMLIGLANLSGYYHSNQLCPEINLAMELNVRKLCEGYKNKIKNSVDSIKDVLEKSVENSANLVLNGYPRLIKEVKDLMSDKISSNQLETKKLLETFIEAQRSFININHPHFKEARMHLSELNFIKKQPLFLQDKNPFFDIFKST